MLKTYALEPEPGYVQLRIFSGVPGCQYKIQTNNTDLPEIVLNGIDYWSDQYVRVEHQWLTMTYTIKEDKQGCPRFAPGIYTFNETTAYSIFLQNEYPDEAVLVYEEQVEKSSKASPLVRNLVNMDKQRQIKWKDSKSSAIESEKPANYRKIIELRAATYEVLVDDIKVHEEKLRHGGVYSLIIGTQQNGDIVTKIFEVIAPNSINILWLVPQYFILTLGEVMFSVTGLEFSYSQSPVTMKSVLQACWLLTVAFGNVFMVIIAELKFFQSQAKEFFLFAGLMFVDMILFMWLAYRYKPNNPVEEEAKAMLSAKRLSVENVAAAGSQQQNRAMRERSVKGQPKQFRYTKRQVD